MNVNKTILVGNITQDPELKTLPSGTQVCSFSLATNEFFSKDGKKEQRTEFHNIVAFGKTAENIATYMRKGSQIYVEGKLQTRSWEQDGMKRYRTEIIALNVQFGPKPKSDDESRPARTDRNDGYDQDTATPPDHDEEQINPEDIPF